MSLDPELISVNPSGLIDSLGLAGVGGVSGVSGLWICNVICSVLIVTLNMHEEKKRKKSRLIQENIHFFSLRKEM